MPTRQTLKTFFGFPARQPGKIIAFATLGGFVAIGWIALLGQLLNQPLILGSFGASCVLVFGYPDSPFSKAKQVIGGHVISAASGLIILSTLGSGPLAMACALGLAIFLMHVTRTVHPPAGSNPVIVMLSQPGWHFLLTPVLVGAVLLAATGWSFNRLTKPFKS
ncbi:HPP family protein [Leeia oryzae]|uniref:HPP family protein n=1 Tax=Leeia oryzae TaxID=356662 RepID=UPI0003732DAF|nr:HPP family protein [Leeia oryzae]